MDGERQEGRVQGRGYGEKAWCNGGTSLRVSAPHQRVELQPVDVARTMPPGERRTATKGAEGPSRSSPGR